MQNFTKQHIPWNKGKKGLQKHTPEQREKARQRFLKNNPSSKPENRIKISKRFSGVNNHAWTGDKVTNMALHRWVKKQLGSPNLCYICSSSNGWMDLANTTGVYNRDLINWIPLCRKCHAFFDKRKSKYTIQELIDFENNIVDLFNEGKILSPIHLSGGDESQKIRIFKLINRNDVVYSTYRSHYDALLHGVDKEWLTNWILSNKSIHVMHKEPTLITSAIVGGTVSQAIGSALAIKMKKEKRKVWCMIGDMTATTGIFWECYNYAIKENLPVVFVIADNGLSTDTPTKEVWGMKETDKHWFEERPHPKIMYYKFKRTRQHYGTGKFVAEIWKDIIQKEDVRNKGF